jgi:hypothetical protein
MMEWISVKDRLPGIGEEVLIVNKFNEIGKGWYCGEYGWNCYDSTLCDNTATHWMPLPELPESEE